MKINFKNFLKNNSSTILTVLGSIGVGITAIMSARDTVKAVKRIDEYQLVELGCVASKKEKIKLAAPCYIPTIISGVSTILCICGANKINKNVQKSLAGAYILLDKSFKEYRNTVRDTYGEDGEMNVVKSISTKKVEEVSPVPATDEYVFFDFYSLQFFKSSIEKIYLAEKEANRILQTNGYVSLETVHSLIGEEVLSTDDLLGWSIGAGRVYGYDRIEFETTKMFKEDGSVYYIIDHLGEPSNDYMYL